MIQRKLSEVLESKLFKNKVIVLIGPRQVGKTTLFKALIQKVSSENNLKTLFLNCDESDVRLLLSQKTSTELKNLTGNAKIIVIDEAQRVKDIGLTLKILFESNPETQILVTGSSSLDLTASISEPLTGRKFEYNLFPFSTEELIKNSNFLEEKRLLKNRLIYGFYPDVVNNPGEEREILTNLATSYLYKDVFEFQDIRKPAVVEKLLQALALQVGSEVSFNELSNLLGIDTMTVQRYVDLLEKAYVIFHLRSFSRNVRNELKKSIKIYFYDNGIRNAIISNFSPIDLRNDAGNLWENFLISERIKRNSYTQNYAKTYFWRTTQKQEIDFIEELDGKISAFEFKFNPKKSNARIPLTFSNNYPNTEFSVITQENYLEFIT